MSYTNLNYHIIFATKSRKPFLDTAKIQRLGEYISGISKNMKSVLLQSNGAADHIHIAISLHPEISLMEFVRTMKTNTSKWIHNEYEDINAFAWQDGYSAFTISYSGLEKVREYIKRQPEHHKKISFEDELAAFLEKHKIDYNPRYI